MKLGAFLHERRDQIVSRFVAAVQQKEMSPAGVARSLLVDHIPGFLDEIAAELLEGERVRLSHDAIDTSPTARKHGSQRWMIGYELDAVIREYGVLRHCVLQMAKDEGVQPTVDEFEVFAKCLSVGVAEAAQRYIEDRDQQIGAQKANLEFLSEAGQLLASSLDYHSTLGSLTALIVPRMADWCAVFLENSALEMPIAHVDPQKVELVREMLRRYPTPDAPDGVQRVVQTGEPQLVTEVSPTLFEERADDADHLALLRELGSHSWMIVPLRAHDHTFGALTFAYSDSSRRYDESDLALAGELARRAAFAIDNAMLFAQSQRERSRAEAAARAKDEFVAMVSHELRTPLNAILGWLRLLRGGTLDEVKKDRALSVIERNADAQSRLVEDLLDISQVISGRIRINPSQVDLSNVVDMAVEGVRPAADAKRIAIEVEIDREQSVIRADGNRLQQVAWNLLTNAVKFTPKDGTVRVRVRRVASEIEVVVSDTGEGIDAEFLPHVFESFRQSDGSTSRTYGGLGIGLSIAKHIVELHGGAIDVQSGGKGRGATFTLRLPVSPLISPTLGVSRVPATTQDSQAPARHALAGIRILVVDDEPDARELLAHLLESCGVEVRAAASAAEALGELVQYRPHVIVSDIGMPVEDGYSLVRKIRTHADVAVRAVPVIALTAFASHVDRRRALTEGFNLHMAKPVEPAELVRAVADLSGQTSSGAP